jgi:hypothetical protein
MGDFGIVPRAFDREAAEHFSIQRGKARQESYAIPTVFVSIPHWQCQ